MGTIKSLFAIDSHTAGEPLRLIVGGVPMLKGNSVSEKRDYFREHYDYLRCAIMREPRGHKDMFGAILTEPVMPEADLGVFFIHGDGYHNMCGHGSIATATIAVDHGLVEVKEPETIIKMETPAGLVEAKVAVENGKAKRVTLKNVPSFLYKKDVCVDVPKYGKLTVDIAFGGNFFAVVPAKQLNIDICPENTSKLAEAGMAIINAVNASVKVQHPVMDYIKGIDECEIFGPAKSPDADYQNITIFDGQVDRSPCGTGTSSKAAVLYARGELEIGQEFVYESVIQTKFIGKAVEKVKVGDFDAILPEVTGSAYITGISHIMIDSDDPVKYGFVLK